MRNGWIVCVTAIGLMLCAGCAKTGQILSGLEEKKESAKMLKYEEVGLKTFDEAPLKMQLLYSEKAPVERRPVILMPGQATPEKHPEWLEGLLQEGYMVAAFTIERPPDPDPARRPVFLHFDEKFANSYAAMGYYAPRDAQTIFDYFATRKDINMDKIGWVGASSTGIPGLAVATQGPRLAAVVAFVATGAYEEWLQTWHTNHLWKGGSDGLWPETKDYLAKYDPIRHVDKMFPAAICMVSGGGDGVVDAKTAQSFMKAARPYYESDPYRLRLAIYDGMGHNLSGDIVKMHVENWFRLYMHPTNPAPKPEGGEVSLKQAVKNSQITGADHSKLTGSK